MSEVYEIGSLTGANPEIVLVAGDLTSVDGLRAASCDLGKFLNREIPAALLDHLIKVAAGIPRDVPVDIIADRFIEALGYHEREDLED